MQVLNWYSAGGFSIYAEDELKRYCLWSMTSFAQRRGNLYRNSELAKQLETIAMRARLRQGRKAFHSLAPQGRGWSEGVRMIPYRTAGAPSSHLLPAGEKE